MVDIDRGYGLPIGDIATSTKYCTEDDVKHFLPENIIAESEAFTPNPMNPEPVTLQNIDIDFFITQACSRIDAALATIYDVPLKKVNQGGEIDFPYPVRTIAAILTSQMIFEQRLQGADRVRSESQKEREKWAEDELLLIQNGERKLMGIRVTRGNRFVRGTLPNVPRNPAVEGKSSGGGK